MLLLLCSCADMQVYEAAHKKQLELEAKINDLEAKSINPKVIKELNDQLEHINTDVEDMKPTWPDKLIDLGMLLLLGVFGVKGTAVGVRKLRSRSA